MNHQEEQEMEIEALTSIFEEGREFFTISPTEFRLKLLPCPAGEGDNHVEATLHVTYTAEYPEVAPDWELQDVKLPDEKLPQLKAKIEETIDASLGMAMIYSVAEAMQDWLKENNIKPLSMHEEMMQRAGGDEPDEEDDDDDESGEEEEEEWKGLADKNLCLESDRITPDIFHVWKLKFDQELMDEGILRREGENKAKTGKQIFMEAGKDGEKEGGKEASSEKDSSAASPVVYNAALFGEVDDEDLDDLSD